MKSIQKIKEYIKRNRYGKMFLEQYGFKTMTLGICSSTVNLCFAAINLTGALKYGSAWYAALAGYYFALIVFRLAVIIADVKGRKKYNDDEKGYELLQNKIMLAGGAYLVIVEIAMSIIITLTIIFGRPVKSGKIIAIATAAYAFYKITMSVINLVKAKSFGNPVIQSLRNLNFADACMTMTSLTAILLTTFGADSEGRFLLAMKSSVGFAACLIVLAIATVMIIKSVNRIKEVKTNGF